MLLRIGKELEELICGRPHIADAAIRRQGADVQQDARGTLEFHVSIIRCGLPHTAASSAFSMHITLHGKVSWPAMIFIEWWIVRRVCYALLLIACATAAFWSVRKKRWPIRLPVRILSAPATLLAVLFLLLQWKAAGCISYSSAVYSPDHRMAARIRTDDEGATGGNSTVELFDVHGLLQYDVYWGSWNSVEPGWVRWIDATHLRIEYDGTSYFCKSTRKVKVECRSRSETVQ
jgi:hypothetical protein